MIQPRRLKQLLKRMTDIYSPSGKEEDILEFLKGYLKRRGIAVTVQPVDEKRYNLICMPQGDAEARLAFIGHVDTVTAYDLECFGFSEEGDRLTGLGTADMKGGCAAMTEAYLTYCESGYSGRPVALCLVVGEEESGDGARQLLKNYHFPWAIIGEPTDMIPCLGCYGYLEIEITSSGRRVHASVADPRQSPVATLLRKMLRIIRYLEKERSDLIYNIRDIFTSQAGFAVPEYCEAWLDFHVPPGIPLGEILAETEEIWIREKEGGSDVQTTFRSTTIDAGFEIPDRGMVPDALRAVWQERGMAWKSSAFRSHSDANQLWTAGIKPIVLGPGQLSQAHSEDESVSFRQVCEAAEIYLSLMLRID